MSGMSAETRRQAILARRAAAKQQSQEIAAQRGPGRTVTSVVSPMTRSRTVSAISPRVMHQTYSLPSSGNVSPRSSAGSSGSVSRPRSQSHADQFVSSPVPKLITTTTTVRKSTPWDMDLVALEKTLSTMDSSDKDFKDSALLFMAARWREIPPVKERSENFQVSMEQWLDYWDDEERGTKQIGRLVASKCWHVLMDKRRIGSVGITEIDTFSKACQRRWRELAIKGEEILMQFEWFYEQRRQQMRNEVIDAVRAEISAEYEDHIANLAKQLAQTRIDNESRATKVSELVEEIQTTREKYEDEIATLNDRLAEFEGEYCNIIRHTEVVDDLYPALQKEFERLQKDYETLRLRNEQETLAHNQQTETSRTQHQNEIDLLKRDLTLARAQSDAQVDKETSLREEHLRQLNELKERMSFHQEREEQERRAKESVQEELRNEKDKSAQAAIASVQDQAEREKLLREETTRQLEEMKSRIAFHSEREEEERREKIAAQNKYDEETRAKSELMHELDQLKREFESKSSISAEEAAENERRLREQHAKEIEALERELNDTRQREEQERHSKEVAAKRAAKEATKRRNVQSEMAQLKRSHAEEQARFAAEKEVDELRIILEERKRSQRELGAELERVRAEAERAYLEGLRRKNMMFGDTPGAAVEELKEDEEMLLLTKGETMDIQADIRQIEIESKWNETDSNNPVDVDVSFSLFSQNKTHICDITFDDPNYQDLIILHENIHQGGGEGEKGNIVLDQIPDGVAYIVVSVTIDSGAVSFRDVENCSLWISNCDTSVGICRFELKESASHDCNALVMAFLSRSTTGGGEGAEWSLTMIGDIANGACVEEIHEDIQDFLLAV